MSVVRRGRIFWCDFWWDKRRYQLSTLQTDKREAAKVEAAFKGKLLRGGTAQAGDHADTSAIHH